MPVTEKQIAFWITCDGEECEGSGFGAPIAMGWFAVDIDSNVHQEAATIALNSGWTVNGQDFYCPNCWARLTGQEPPFVVIEGRGLFRKDDIVRHNNGRIGVKSGARSVWLA